MPDIKSHRPRPAFCEDWDEDAQTTVSSSRATANVAVRRSPQDHPSYTKDSRPQHDGIDSGYSSRAGTVASEPTTRKTMTDIRIDTAIPERTRQPYHGVVAQPPLRRTSGSRPDGTSSEPRSVKEKPFVHERGLCMTCDHYGRHYNLDDLPRSSSMAPNSSSPRIAKKGTANPVQEQRPANNLPPITTQLPYMVNPAAYAWATPMTPTMPYSPNVYSYTTTLASATPSFASYPGTASFYEPAHAPESRPAKLSRRSTMYEKPIVKHSRNEDDSRRSEKVSPNTESRPTLTTHRSTRSVDQDRADRARMPPPEKPAKKPNGDPEKKPSMKRASTHNPSIVDPRRSQHYDEQDYAIPAPDSRPRQNSPSRPPSAWRGSVGETKRPQAQRKSVSYTDAPQTVRTTGSTSQMPAPQRQAAAPISTLEDKEASAEAYQRKRSNMTSEELTSEKLREISGKNLSSRSESGSNLSRRSQHSSSKGSSGRARSHTSGAKTSIVLDGGLTVDIPADFKGKDGRPVSINLGDLTISVNSNDRDGDRRREKPLLERTSSLISRASKRSGASSSVVSSGKGKERDDTRPSTSRRESLKDERAPATTSKKSSHQHSRTSSNARSSFDYGRAGRSSVDYARD